MTRRSFLVLVAGLGLAACGARALPPPASDGPTQLSDRLVVDTRRPQAFAAGHHEGALNIQVGWSQLGARIASYVPDRETRIALRCADADEAAAAAAILADAGYENVRWLEAGEESATLPLWKTPELRRRLAGPDPPVVLDVRSRREREQGSIPGSIFVDEDDGPASVASLDRARTYAVICEAGWRSSQLASWMRREGFDRVWNVVDGMAGWRRGSSSADSE